MKNTVTGPTVQLNDLPNDTPINYRKYLKPTLILVIMCFIAVCFGSTSSSPRWLEWGWNKGDLGLFVLIVAPFCGIWFSVAIHPFISAYREKHGLDV